MGKYKGSHIQKVNKNISITCMSEDGRNLLDRIMIKWNLYEKSTNNKSSIYSFAYWLVRYSDLIQPK